MIVRFCAIKAPSNCETHQLPSPCSTNPGKYYSSGPVVLNGRKSGAHDWNVKAVCGVCRVTPLSTDSPPLSLESATQTDRQSEWRQPTHRFSSAVFSPSSFCPLALCPFQSSREKITISDFTVIIRLIIFSIVKSDLNINDKDLSSLGIYRPCVCFLEKIENHIVLSSCPGSLARDHFRRCRTWLLLHTHLRNNLSLSLSLSLLDRLYSRCTCLGAACACLGCLR